MYSGSLKQNKMCLFLSEKKLNDPSLKLDGLVIPLVDEYKFLWIISDKTTNIHFPLKIPKTRCNKTRQLLRVVAHKEWGADRNSLLRLYRPLIRSKLDYGNCIYRSAIKYYLKKRINSIDHGDIKLIHGGCRISPADSQYEETNEALGNIRNLKLALQYYVKLKSCPANPAHINTFLI